MALKDIVDVQIVRQTAAITQVGFGTLAFVYDAATAASARVLSFGSPDEVAASTDLTATAKAALTAAFSGDIRPDRVKAIYKLTSGAPETYTAALNAAVAVDVDWYCITIQSRVAADITEVATWAESRTKLFIAATAQATVLDPISTTDIGATLAAASRSRTGLIYAADAATTWPDTAWAGGMLPNDPGTVTWAFKRAPGVAGQIFSGSAITALETKRVTRVETILGLSRTVGGYTSDAGAFIDIIRGIDWLQQRMAEDLFMRLVNSAKIPYTNAGIAIVEGVVRARLQDAINRNILVDDESLTITVPDVSDTSQTDRAARTLRDVKFTARLAGAIHKIIVRGTVSV